MELFPHQPKEVQILLDKIEANKKHLDLLVKAYDVSRYAIQQNSVTMRRQMQELCVHPHTKTEHDFDYHKREDWTNEICTVCDKTVRRF